MKIHDLSPPITPELAVFPGDTPPSREVLLDMVRGGRAEDLIGAMAWQQNPTRWCSTGNLVATMRVTGAESVEILRYLAAIDQQGATMVSSVAGYVA